MSGFPTASSPFDFGTRLGLVFIVEVASLSATAVVSLLAFICYSTIKAQPRGVRTWAVSTHIHYYFVNLLVCDLIQAIGGIMDIRWIAEAVSDPQFDGDTDLTPPSQERDRGNILYCSRNFQAARRSWSGLISIAIHTFLVLVFKYYARPKVAPLVVIMIWTFLGLVVGVSLAIHHGEIYYGNTQYWCWITRDFRTEQIALEYGWVWFAASVNIMCYAMIALVLKGIVLVDGYKIRLRRRSDASSVETSIDGTIEMSPSVQRSNAIAMQMLLGLLSYPAVYLVAIFPMSLVRWLSFFGMKVPFIATAFASILFSSSGILNVTLFTLTRPGLVPNRGPSNSQRSCEYYGSIPNPGVETGFRHSSVSPRTQAEDSIEGERWKCLLGRNSDSWNAETLSANVGHKTASSMVLSRTGCGVHDR
ncbi:hypothetical protein DFS33DRAFT_1270966 [Desarmillaria ectypa]|nr:hypothetical protein DFS33DRAFT_1270966 [Desarmillaria ectypa]